MKRKRQHSTRQIAAWLWQHYKDCRLQAMLNVSIGLAQVVLGLVGVDTLRRLADIATHAREGSLLWSAVLLACVFLAELLLGISHTWVAAVLGVKTQTRMQQSFFRRLLRGRWDGVDRYHSGDVLNRLFDDVNDIVSLMTTVLPSSIVVVMQFTTSFIYLYVMDSSLALIVVAVSPFFMLLSKIYFRRMRRIVRTIKDSNSSIQSIIQESIQHKLVIKVLRRDELMASRLEQRQSLLRKQVRSRARFSIFARSVVTLGFAGGYLAALAWGLVQLHDGLITVGVLMAFTQLVNRIQRPMLDAARLLPVFVNSLTSSDRLMELDDLPLEEQAEPITVEDDMGILFDNVSYSYSEEGRMVVNHFTHDFRPGTFTAILGETGVGKTTLIRLMLALITPSEGAVLAYGKCVRHPVSPSLRGSFSYIPQGNTLFSGTIRDNLFLGNPCATAEQMREALHLAMADFIFDLPQGLDTRCSEQGGGLSEGQAQRIAIARALLHPCRVLLLDEATSALDPETERQVLANLKRHCAGTTIIFVTHRLSVTEFCDEQLTMG